MIKYFFQGLMLGFAYVAPIGMQNLYVINSAMVSKKIKAYKTAFITSFFDISLALACFFGVGSIMEQYRLLKLAILFIGSIVVIYLGLKIITQKIEVKNNEKYVEKSIAKVITSCFMVTFANPQAIIDGSLLLGGYRLALPYNTKGFFIVGVCIASFTWFTGITIFTVRFKNIFSNKIVNGINIVCGIIIVFYGIKLGYSFISYFIIK